MVELFLELFDLMFVKYYIVLEVKIWNDFENNLEVLFEDIDCVWFGVCLNFYLCCWFVDCVVMIEFLLFIIFLVLC